MMKRLRTTLFSFLLILLLMFLSFWAIFSLSLTLARGHFFINHRADRLDFAAYKMASHILHSKSASQLYNYKFQKQKFNELYDEFKNTSKNIFPEKFLNKQDKEFLAKPSLNNIYFYNSPNSLFLLYLLGFFNIDQAWLLLNFLSVVLLGLAVFVAFKGRFRSKMFLVFVLALISWIPFRQALFQGQISLLVAVSFFYYFYFASKQKYLFAGFALFVSLLKVHIGLPLIVCALLFKDFKSPFYAFGLTFTSLAFAYCLIGLEGLTDYFKTFKSILFPLSSTWYVPELATNNLWAESIKGQLLLWFNDLGLVNLLHFVFSVVCISLVVYFAIKNYLSKASLEKQSLQFSLIALLLILPISYINEHDYCFVVSLVLVLVYALREKSSKVLNYFCFGFSLPVLIAYSLIGSSRLMSVFHLHLIFILAFVFTLTLFLFSTKLVGEQGSNGKKSG